MLDCCWKVPVLPSAELMPHGRQISICMSDEVTLQLSLRAKLHIWSDEILTLAPTLHGVRQKHDHRADKVIGADVQGFVMCSPAPKALIGQGSTLASCSLPACDSGRSSAAWRTKKASTRRAKRSTSAAV